MPREAPVTRAMREARGFVIEATLSASSLRAQGPKRRDGYDGGRCVYPMASGKRGPVLWGPCVRRDDTVSIASSLPPAATVAAAAARPGSGRSDGSDRRR